MNELQTNDKLKDSLLSQDKFSHYMQVASELSKSELVPKNMKGKPMDILLAMEMAYQIGLPLLQGLQAIAVINGKTCMYGDDLLAVVQAHKDYEWMKEEPLLESNVIVGYKCSIKRKHHEVHESIFTVNDARKANLLNKAGVWQQYPQRMLQMRARGFALRDCFSDALRGIKPAEEVRDYADGEIIDSKIVEQDKRTQTSKLLERINNQKGTLSDDKKSNKPINSHTNDPSNIDSSSGDKNQNINIASVNIKDQDSARMAETGKQEDDSCGAEIIHQAITRDQLDAIDCLLHEKQFSPKRVSDAFKYFNVKNFAEMDYQQAEEMISILGKAD